jgi:hypothetical protein
LRAYVRVRADEDDDRISYIDEHESSTGPSIGAAASDDVPYVTASGSAYAEWGGHLRSVASADAVNPGEGSLDSIVNTEASVRESIVITSAKVSNGTPGVGTATMAYDGSIRGMIHGLSDTSIRYGTNENRLTVSVANVTREVRHRQTYNLTGGSVNANRIEEKIDADPADPWDIVDQSSNTAPVGHTFSHTLGFEFDFVFGNPFTFDAELSWDANPALAFSPGDELDLIGDAGNSAKWQGISSV